MAYLKSFEIFESELNDVQEGEINEAATAIKINPELKQMLTSKVKALTPEDKEKLKSQLLDFGKTFKLSAEMMKNPEAVAKALLDAGMVKENFSYDGDVDDINEGLKDWWEKSKNKVYKFMAKSGFGGILGSMATVAYGAALMPDTTYLASNVTVTPNAWVIAGGAAMAISLLTMLVGLKGTGDLDAVASAAASVKR
jgi:hypothetical protein